MSTDPTVLHRLYLAQIGPDAIKQALTTVPPAQSKFDFRPFRDALSCCVCFTVPKHFRLLLSCVNGHLQCRDCLFYSNSGECVCFFFVYEFRNFIFIIFIFFSDRCSLCRSSSCYFKARGLQTILECGAVGDETCSFCAFSGPYGAVVAHERRVHTWRLSYLPIRNPKVGLTLDAMDWKSAITCAFCDQIFLPGQVLSSCLDGHILCSNCLPSQGVCTVGACDFLSNSRPHILEQLVLSIHQVQTFSCHTNGCQFRSTLVIVLAHQRVCSEPTLYNPRYNDFRKEPNCREDLIFFRHPTRHVEGSRVEPQRLPETITIV